MAAISYTTKSHNPECLNLNVTRYVPSQMLPVGFLFLSVCVMVTYACSPHRKSYRMRVMRCKPRFSEIPIIKETTFFIAQQPLVGQDFLIIETSRSNSFRHNTLGGNPLDE
jgi:hypothetical protein